MVDFSDIIVFGVIFTMGALLDILMAAYVIFVAKRQKFMAAYVSMATGTVSLAGFLEVVQTKWLGVAWVLGLGAGTVIALTLAEHMEKKNGVQQ